MPAPDETTRAHLNLLETYVQRLLRWHGTTLEQLETDPEREWAVVHGLQLCAQCVIDISQHTIAELNLGSPGKSVEAIKVLRNAGAFTPELAETLTSITRFRNVVVHKYAEVDLKIVHSALETELRDFGEFARQLLDYLDQLPKDGASE